MFSLVFQLDQKIVARSRIFRLVRLPQMTGYGSFGSGSAVAGLAWRTWSLSPAKANSTSCGPPKNRSILTAVFARSFSIRALSSEACPADVASPDFSMTTCTGCVFPETMASPVPRTALTSNWHRSPLRGLAVKMTPETSAGIICCTTTAISADSGARPLLRR